MTLPHLNLWQKTLILTCFSIPVTLYLFRDEVKVPLERRISLMTECEKPRTFRVSNLLTPDSLTSDLERQLTTFMKRNGLRGGVSVSISRHGKLVFSKGIGYSDLADSSIMEPHNVMRVASVSKLITAVAVMKLVEDGKLFLDQKVFGPVGVLNDETYSVFRDKRMRDITIRQLLNHSGGWSARYGDPMFMHSAIDNYTGCGLPLNMEDIIHFMQCKSLHFTPGSVSVYSNFGYGILGEVIAKASGMPYELYVQSKILHPLGIYDAALGFSHIDERLPDEVAYYEPDTASLVPDYAVKGNFSRRAYGGSDIHTLGAAGGWVISTVDLLKLLLVIDGYNSVPDILTLADVVNMTEPQGDLDPLGWRKVIGGFWFRSGTLSATSAALGRRPDGICFVAVLNSSSGSLGPNLAILLANKMNELINRIPYWPEHDILEDDQAWCAYKALHSN